MLHRALFGSIERFFGVLVEHYAGAFPTWLSPIQVRVLPVAEAHQDYADSVVRRLESEGVRVDLVEANDQLGKRIRTAKLDKVPYVLVVGDDDVSAGTVGVNARGANVERGVSVGAFIERVRSEISVGVVDG
jgi:threonyl-tRNA synthetase